MRLRVFPVLAVSAGLMLAVTSTYSCRQEADRALAGAVDTVRVQLQWFNQAQFAGLYVAQRDGHFDRAGLHVELVNGGYSVKPIDEVRSGRSHIGMVTGDRLLVEAAERADLKAIGTVFNRSVATFMFKGGGTRRPEDLRGKKVGVYVGYDTENLLKTILTRYRIDPSELTIVPAGALDAFRSGELDVFPSYVFNEPLRMRAAGVEVSLMRPEELGIQYYSDTFFVTKEYWDSHQGILRRFLGATAAGWEAAERNPDRAVSVMLAGVRTLLDSDSTFQISMLRALLPYLRDGERRQMLYMTRSRWEGMEQALLDAGVIKTTGNVERLCDFSLVPSSQQ